MNKALQGNQAEKDFTILLNKKINLKLWEELGVSSLGCFAIHITSNKLSNITNRLIACKSDVFIASGIIDKDTLIKKKHYLSEEDLITLNLQYLPLSGISVKLKDSNYTIAKISSSTFLKYFSSNILAAGSSIYTTKNFHLNNSILSGWGVSLTSFIDLFSSRLDICFTSLSDKVVLSKIKSYSNSEIRKIISNSKMLSDMIFKGINHFKDPFFANWIYCGVSIKKNVQIPFSITTGSGRSKGIYTIVLKPKKIK